MKALAWLLQAGISCADRVVTVSPGYAWEIQTPEGGWGMEGMLTSRSYALNGVLNGVDLVEWDPENDPHIYQNYGETSFAEGKRANKAGLQKEMGLPQRPEVCIASADDCCSAVESTKQWPAVQLAASKVVHVTSTVDVASLPNIRASVAC